MGHRNTCLQYYMTTPLFHFTSYQAVEHILPYTCKFDSTSWWYSTWHTSAKVEVMFAGQSVMYTGVVALNPKHRPYPRRGIEHKQWPALMREVEANLPEEYRNASLLMEWKKQEVSHQERSSSLCLPPPPTCP